MHTFNSKCLYTYFKFTMQHLYTRTFSTLLDRRIVFAGVSLSFRSKLILKVFVLL